MRVIPSLTDLYRSVDTFVVLWPGIHKWPKHGKKGRSHGCLLPSDAL